MDITEALPNLSPAIGRVTLHMLIDALPSPISGSQEERAAREEAAIAALAMLEPQDAFEATVAARIVGTDAHAMDCLRRAGQAGADDRAARTQRAQAAAMMRMSDSALRTLQDRHAARRKAAEAARAEPKPAPESSIAQPLRPRPANGSTEAPDFIQAAAVNLTHRDTETPMRRVQAVAPPSTGSATPVT
jgi:hypothetical protein